MTGSTSNNPKNGFDTQFEQDLKQLEKTINFVATLLATGKEHTTDATNLEKLNQLLASTKEVEKDLKNLVNRFNKLNVTL